VEAVDGVGSGTSAGSIYIGDGGHTTGTGIGRAGAGGTGAGRAGAGAGAGATGGGTSGGWERKFEGPGL
jgi:hypothetical protein